MEAEKLGWLVELTMRTIDIISELAMVKALIKSRPLRAQELAEKLIERIKRSEHDAGNDFTL